MGERDAGLTLEGLAQKLETQAQSLEALKRENTELRRKVATLEGPGTRRNELPEKRGSNTRRSGDGEAALAFDGQVSRRSLLSKAGAAAVAAVAAGTLLYPREAKAHHYSDSEEDAIIWNAHRVVTHYLSAISDEGMDAARIKTTSDDFPAAHCVNEGSGPGVLGIATGLGGKGVAGTGYYGVWGESNRAGFYGVLGRNDLTDGTGVRGVTNNTDGRAGVRGEGATGVWGNSPKTGYSGVYGEHTGSAGYGVVGDGTGNGAGVLGRNSGGEGVRGQGSTTAEVAGVRGLGKTGVWGSSSVTGYSGVYGEHTGSSGYGVVGEGRGRSGAGVVGRNHSGYGGQFEGGKAQLKLKPGGARGKPTTGTHTKGEIYMDSAGTLFVCTEGDGTTLGTWRKVTTTAV